MNIAIVGTGYVGLVTGACFAEMGINVVCIDIDEVKIGKLLNGVMPIYEPRLKEMVLKNNAEGRLKFSTSLKESIDSAEVIFSAVGTPPDEDGSADLKYVLDVARTIGQNIQSYKLIVTKSTVPVGTAHKVKDVIDAELKKRGVEIDYDVASNPEFLKEGAAIKDFLNPDRVVIGVESEKAKHLMEKLYRPFLLNGYPLMFMDIPSAEMTKYAANAMLATRISFMNEIAALCEVTGANVDFVRKGVGSDKRIGDRFLYPGAGYGGSCFPKDVKALINTGAQFSVNMSVIKAVDEANNFQKSVVFRKLNKAFNNDLNGKVIALWGLSYKPDTDDMREAPALVIIEKLIQAGSIVRVFDPVAMEETRHKIGNSVIYCQDMYDACTGADASALLTEWKQFRMPEWKRVKELMNGNTIIDGRNIYIKEEVVAEGFTYTGIGK